MARCSSGWCRAQHKFCETTRSLGASPPGRFVLVGGPRPYLNVHSDVPGALYHMSGPKQLRRLAHAILRTVKAPKPKPKTRRARGRRK